jgi:hypothetical protein
MVEQEGGPLRRAGTHIDDVSDTTVPPGVVRTPAAAISLPELVATPTPVNRLNVPTAEVDYMETTSTYRLSSPGKGLADAHS